MHPPTRPLVLPDTVLVTSYAVQALLALTYGAGLWGFWRLYRQHYLRDWAYAWAAYAAYAVAAGLAYWWASVTRLAPSDPRRVVASTLTIQTGLAYGLLLLRGMRRATGERTGGPHRVWAVAVSGTLLAVAGVLLTASSDVSREVRVFVRVTALMGAMGTLAILAGRRAWRQGATQEWWGFRLLGAILVVFGAKEVVNGLLLQGAGTYPGLGPSLTVLDAILAPVVGSSMVVTLLVIERARAQAAREAEARAQAALQANEQRLRSIIEGTSDVIVVLDDQARVTFIGPSCTRILGWTDAEIVGASALDFVHPADVPTARDALARVLGGEQAVPAAELRLRARDGAHRLMEVLSQRIGAGTASATQLVISARDLSERVALEARLLQAQKLESIGQLAGGVAHDFNNILTSIIGHVSMARLGAPADPQLRAELDDIQRSAERAAELTRQLLAFARRQVIEPVVLDLNASVDGLRRLLGRLIGEHITLATELAPGLWPVRADPAPLEQAVVNLALNARDAMPQGGRLRLTTANVDVSAQEAQAHGLKAGGEYVRLVVQDSGLGMDEATRQRIFEPFFTTKAGSGGTGLGLAMVHGVVAQSGGGIAVFSAPGQGARFSILLPRYEGPIAPAPAPVAPRVITPERTATILLVEDEPQVRAVASRVLRMGGYSVLEAVDGADGVAKSAAFAGRIDLVVSDLVMPGMSGPAMWEKVRVARPGTRVLFMSGFSADTLPDGGTLPADASYIDKPFTVDALLAKVRDDLQPR